MASFVALCILLGAGHLLRSRIKLLARLYLPSCVVAGLSGLIIIQAFAAMAGLSESANKISSLLAEWSAPWQILPAFLINIVFACLFLGFELPGLATITKRAGPQLVYGQIVAWGQYVVAIGLWLLVLARFFPTLPSMFAAVLPVGFEGGHGTAAGMGPVFEYYNWAAGKDLALTSATFGVLSAIIVGMVLVNWAVRRGHLENPPTDRLTRGVNSAGLINIDKRPSAGKLTVNSDVIETFSLHIVFVGIAIGLGYAARSVLVGIENYVPWISKHRLLSGFPLFPLCMLGGLVVQIIEQRFDKGRIIDIGMTRRIQNAALDFLVVAAIATIKLKVVLSAIVPLLILVAAGIAWNVFCLMYLARRILPDAWFERAIAEMGQSMGVTATGLLLLRVVDPKFKSNAANAFACKQLLHEPIMGGGLWTGMAIPLIAVAGAGRVFVIAAVACLIWLTIAFLPKLIRRTHPPV